MSSNDGKICYKFDSDALLARELLDMGLYMGLYGSKYHMGNNTTEYL